MPEPGALSLLPVAVTLIVALTARNVLAGLFAGVLVGVAMIATPSPLQLLQFPYAPSRSTSCIEAP